MIRPPGLKNGDLVQLVSPAGKVSQGPVMQACDWLAGQGFRVILGDHLFSSHFQFSGTDSERLSDLQSAFDNPEVKAVFCTRGGYGIVRLIEKIDLTGIKKNPKWLVGYSDVTVLHCLLNRAGISTLHGTMARSFAENLLENPENLESMLKLLRGEKTDYSFPSDPLNRPGEATGTLVGGNLSLICSLQATPYELDTRNKILFLEDTSEYLYHIDRMMHNLKLSGKLKELKGLVIGDFSDVKDNEEPFGKQVKEIITDAVKNYSFPVCFGFPAGHEKKNLALVFGKKWHLTVTNETCGFKMT